MIFSPDLEGRGFKREQIDGKKRLIFPHISGREEKRIDRWGQKGRFSANARGRVFVFFNLREREL